MCGDIPALRGPSFDEGQVWLPPTQRGSPRLQTVALNSTLKFHFCMSTLANGCLIPCPPSHQREATSYSPDDVKYAVHESQGSRSNKTSSCRRQHGSVHCLPCPCFCLQALHIPSDEPYQLCSILLGRTSLCWRHACRRRSCCFSERAV